MNEIVAAVESRVSCRCRTQLGGGSDSGLYFPADDELESFVRLHKFISAEL